MSEARNIRPSGADATVQRERYHLLEHLLNGLCGLAQQAGVGVVSLDRARLLQAARRQTRLEDAGEERFIEGLDRILAESAGRFTPLGAVLLRNLLVKAIGNRLRVVDYLKRHPDVRQIPIRRPIVVLGFPRSGTTLLQVLLAASPGRAPLEFWELMSVTPRIEADPERDRAVRIREIDRILRVANLFVPELDRIHHSTPTSPEEDWQLLVPSFQALTFVLAYGLEEYGRWLLGQADMAWAYGELKQRLQIILHQRPRAQLVLKCPDHLWFLDALLRVFPDACVVQTHRDPVCCLTSYTSMISLQERTLRGRIDWKPLAERLTRTFRKGVERAQEARSRCDARQFFDVAFDELVRDPRGVVQRISEHFRLDPPGDEFLQTALRRPRADRPGSHSYSCERLGIDPEAIRDQCRWSVDA
jgi:hypothetical protein